MKNKLFALLLTGLLLAGTVMAQPPMPGKDVPPFQSLCFNQLQLTDEQQSQMDQLRLAFEKEMLPLRDQMKSLQTQYRLKVIDEKAGMAELKKLQGKISALREQMALKRAEHVRKVRAILTDEQKVKFDQRFLAPKKHPGHHRPGMMGPQGKRPGMRPGLR